MAARATIGTHEDRPLKPITVLTYQALSVPGRESEYLDELAMKEWIDETSRSSAQDASERIRELKENNPKAYKKELSRHQSRLRKHLVDAIDLRQVLHPNAISLIEELKRNQCGLVIFDECHHLTDYWAAVMQKFVSQLDNMIVVGLTGTPPEGKSSTQQNRYLTLVGDIDYQVATPALVKEGGLAPFQDLVLFAEPTDKEREFLRSQHEEFHELLKELDAQLGLWIEEKMTERSHNWNEFVEVSPDLAIAMARFLYAHKLPLPKELELSDSVRQAPMLDDLIVLLEDYCLNRLKVSNEEKDQELLKRISNAIKKIGFSLSERGIRKVASPVDRVLAYSQGKSHAVAEVLDVEYRTMDERLRAVVVTDFERMSPTAIKSVRGVLDENAGGAFSVIYEVLKSTVGGFINPCLVTGSLLIVDSRIAVQVKEEGEKYLAALGTDLELIIELFDKGQLCNVSAKSSSWSSRLYVPMITALFERGITKCLIGTRGILGEGWDSQQLNTVIDLTTATSPVSVKQLRGRGIRLNTIDPVAERKVANNWDVVCIAPELEKGLNDYKRFVRKHAGYFGISDDGQIECGVGHVHPAFSDLTAAEVFASLESFNEEMLKRALVRDKIYALWEIGKPYANKQLGCVEISKLRHLGQTPPHVHVSKNYETHVRQIRSTMNRVWWQSSMLGAGGSIVAGGILIGSTLPLALAMIPIIVAIVAAQINSGKLRHRLAIGLRQPSSKETVLKAMATAVLAAMKERKFLPQDAKAESINITVRSDQSVRVFLDDVEPRHSETFVRAFQELLAPVTNQPYLVPKYEFPTNGNEDDDEFLTDYMSGQAKPEVGSYHPVPKLLARSEKGRDAFERAWNEYVSPGDIIAAEKNPDVLQKYFGMGPSLAEKLLWE